MQNFTYLDKPYYGIVVFYETMVASTAPKPFKKDGEEPSNENKKGYALNIAFFV